MEILSSVAVLTANSVRIASDQLSDACIACGQ